jgi:hypothetical protein
MGADLYIESLCDAARAKVEGQWEPAIQTRDRLWRERDALEDILKQIISPENRKRLSAQFKKLKGQADAAQARVEELSEFQFGGDGYFRDSYNSTSVLWRLIKPNGDSLSWWADVSGMAYSRKQATLKKMRASVARRKRIMRQNGGGSKRSKAALATLELQITEVEETVVDLPLVEDDGLMSPANVQKFIDLIESCQLSLPTFDELEKNHCTVSKDPYSEDSVEGWHRYYTEKREKLLAYLRKAIQLNEPIRCSL